MTNGCSIAYPFFFHLENPKLLQDTSYIQVDLVQSNQDWEIERYGPFMIDLDTGDIFNNTDKRLYIEVENPDHQTFQPEFSFSDDLMIVDYADESVSISRNNISMSSSDNYRLGFVSYDELRMYLVYNSNFSSYNEWVSINLETAKVENQGYIGFPQYQASSSYQIFSKIGIVQFWLGGADCTGSAYLSFQNETLEFLDTTFIGDTWKVDQARSQFLQLTLDWETNSSLIKLFNEQLDLEEIYEYSTNVLQGLITNGTGSDGFWNDLSFPIMSLIVGIGSVMCSVLLKRSRS